MRRDLGSHGRGTARPETAIDHVQDLLTERLEAPRLLPRQGSRASRRRREHGSGSVLLVLLVCAGGGDHGCNVLPTIPCMSDLLAGWANREPRSPCWPPPALPRGFVDSLLFLARVN